MSWKQVAYLFCTLLLFACGGQTNEPYNESREMVPNPEGYRKDSFVIAATDSTKEKTMSYFPFELEQSNGEWIITAFLGSQELYPKYSDFFHKHGYEGNGPTWEGHIRQILEQIDKPLLSHIDFNVEAGAFFANADSKETQIRFAELLSPIFSDLNKLEEWVKKADRDRIDD